MEEARWQFLGKTLAQFGDFFAHADSFISISYDFVRSSAWRQKAGLDRHASYKIMLAGIRMHCEINEPSAFAGGIAKLPWKSTTATAALHPRPILPAMWLILLAVLSRSTSLLLPAVHRCPRDHESWR